MPDPFAGDEKRLGAIYAMIDGMLEQKQQQIEKICEMLKESESENGESSHEG